MALYRDHKGSLKESMKTVITVKSQQDIIDHLNKAFECMGRVIEEIKFDYCGMDGRIGWETYYVLMRLKGDEGFVVAGMSNGIVE